MACSRGAVVASEKGVVVGRLTFQEDGDVIDCSCMGVGGKAIPPNVDKVSCSHVANLEQVVMTCYAGCSELARPSSSSTCVTDADKRYTTWEALSCHQA